MVEVFHRIICGGGFCARRTTKGRPYEHAVAFADYQKSVEKLSKKQVDIFLGNHPYHNCTLEKRQYMLDNAGENPFINKNGWQIFLKALEDRRADFVRLGY